MANVVKKLAAGLTFEEYSKEMGWATGSGGAYDKFMREESYKQYQQSNPVPDPSPAPDAGKPSTPSAEDVSKDQLAQSQATPTDSEGSARSGRERASRRRRGASSGKRGLATGVRRRASSGLSI